MSESSGYYSLFFEEYDRTNTTLTSSGMNTADIVTISIGSFMGLVVLFLVLCCCCSAGFSKWVDDLINSSQNSDENYADIALRRMQEQQEKKKEDPAVRREKLLASFDKNKVSMVITQDSYVLNKDNDHDSDSSLDTASTHSDSSHSSSDEEDGHNEGTVLDKDEPNVPTVTAVLDDMESEESKEIYLNTTRKSKSTGKDVRIKVPNSCAICLCSYDVDDVVVWSSNKECTHAFHDECILQWLVKNQNGECPCCRSPFTDLPPPNGQQDKERSPWSFRNWRLRYNFLSQRESPSETTIAAGTEEDMA